MSDTTQLFMVAGVWLVICAYIAHFIANWWGRAALFALLVGVPFWELPYGYYNFIQLCREQGGLKTFEVFEPQKLVCADYPFETSANRLLKFGFAGVEARDKGGAVKRVVKDSQEPSAEGGEIHSSYCISFGFVQGLPWRVQRNEYLVTRTVDKRIAARHSDFIWYGTWWQQAALPVLGRGGECRRSDPVAAIATLLLAGSK